MEIDPEIERITDELIEEYNQSTAFKNRFLTFYENTIENNLGNTSLERLIEQVELPQGEELDGS